MGDLFNPAELLAKLRRGVILTGQRPGVWQPPAEAVADDQAEAVEPAGTAAADPAGELLAKLTASLGGAP